MEFPLNNTPVNFYSLNKSKSGQFLAQAGEGHEHIWSGRTTGFEFKLARGKSFEDEHAAWL